MYTLLTVLKIISVIWIIIVIGNFFHSSYFVIVSRIYQTDDESYIIRKAKNLLFLGVFTAWITAVLVYYAEQLVLKKATEYSVNIMYYTGSALLIITVLSAALAIVLTLKKGKNKRMYASVYYNFVGKGFIFSIILWLTALAIR